MSQGPLCPNLSQKVQKEVSQMANRNLSRMILLGGLSLHLNHLKNQYQQNMNLGVSLGQQNAKPGGPEVKSGGHEWPWPRPVLLKSLSSIE